MGNIFLDVSCRELFGYVNFFDFIGEYSQKNQHGCCYFSNAWTPIWT
jgi:hypothetical protein